MNTLVETISNRIQELDKIIEQAQADLVNAPKGTLRICKRKNTHQYYLRTDPKDTRGKYIKKDNEEFVKKLAQRNYAEKILAIVCKEKNCLQLLLNRCKSSDVIEVYNKLSEARQGLIHPYVIPDCLYALRWQEEKYPIYYQPEEHNAIYTERGELVRSKSEKILADKLYAMHIPYHYEKPLYLKGFGTIHPDFTVLNKRTRQEYYWEHFGLMDNPEYCEKAIRKIETLERNGIFPGEKLILTFETSQHSLNMKVVEMMIKEFLM